MRRGSRLALAAVWLALAGAAAFHYSRDVAGRHVEVHDRHFVACHLHPESRPDEGVAPEDMRQVNA